MATIDSQVLHLRFSMYRYDASYAVEVRWAHPGRLALVKPVAIRTTRASTGSCARPSGTTSPSTCCAGVTSTRARR